MDQNGIVPIHHGHVMNDAGLGAIGAESNQPVRQIDATASDHRDSIQRGRDAVPETSKCRVWRPLCTDAFV
jgi:hypothetical protein